MEDAENYPEKEETTKKMEVGGDLVEEETTTRKMEDDESDPEKEETTEKMEDGGAPIEEETTTKKTEDDENDPEKEETTENTVEASDPIEEETKEMEEERNPEPVEIEVKWALPSSPSLSMVLNLSRKRNRSQWKRSQRKKVKFISQKEKMTKDKGKKITKDKGKKIVEPGLGELLELGLIPIPPTIHKFENMQVGSSSKHRPSADEVVLEQRPIMVNEKQIISNLEVIGSIVMPSHLESNVLEPTRIEGMERPDLKDSQLPRLEVACDERKAEDGPCRWRPPENGWLKMNVEGLISEHKMATSAVVRNSDGGFVAANSDTWEPVTYLDTAKLIAVRNALIWAERGDRVRHDKVVVEINSEQVVQHLRDFDTVSWMLPDDIRDIVDECLVEATHFNTIQFANISAEENRLAHCLASRALHQECEGDWEAFNAPEWLQEAIMEDLP